MINEKRLDEFEANLKHLEQIPLDQSKEVIELARLGLRVREFREIYLGEGIGRQRSCVNIEA